MHSRGGAFEQFAQFGECGVHSSASFDNGFHYAYNWSDCSVDEDIEDVISGGCGAHSSSTSTTCSTADGNGSDCTADSLAQDENAATEEETHAACFGYQSEHTAAFSCTGADFLREIIEAANFDL
eukprot:10950246-Karenia_brevis.AAC.1